MKKSLLFVAAMAMAISASAQMPMLKDAADMRVKASTQSKLLAPASRLVKVDGKKAAKQAPRRAEEAPYVLYSAPEGALYYGTDKEGSGYYGTRLIVTPWQEFSYKNISTKPDETIWKTYNYQQEAYTTAKDVVDNSLTYSLEPGYYMHTPMLLNFEATDTFQIGYTNNIYARTPQYAAYATPRVMMDSIAPLSFADWHNGRYYFGSLSTGYLYGSGECTWTDRTDDTTYSGKVWALSQEYPAPMSPLYIEDIFIDVISQTKQPLADGVELKLFVIETEADSVIAEITVTKDDFIKEEGPGTEGTSDYAKLTGEYALYQVVFTQKEVDDYGTEYTVPIVVDKPFTLMLTGLDQEGVDLGFIGVQHCLDSSEKHSADTKLMPGRFVFQDTATGESLALAYSNIGADFTFTGMLDAIEVADELSTYNQETGEQTNQYSDCNLLYVSDDGTMCAVILDAETALPGVLVYTAQPWINEDGDEYYFIDELPEWILDVNVDGSAYGHTESEVYEGETYYYYVIDDGYSIVSVTAQPLPDGVKGRKAELYVMGRGAKAATPIIVIQGDVEEDGITEIGRTNETLSSSKLYNLNGQQLSNSRRGLLVKNGKKVMVK